MEPLVLWFLLFLSPLTGPQPQGGLFESREKCQAMRAEAAQISVLISDCKQVTLKTPDEEA